MEAVVGAIIGAVVQFVSDQANSLLKEKFNEGGDFDQDLGDLNSHFIRINGTLHDARMQQITSMAVALWLKKLEDAAFEADNALDEFNYHLLRKKAETSRKRKKSTIFSILGQRIKDINKMMDSINREAADCGIHQMLIGGVRAPGVGSDASAISQSLETDSFTVDPIFIGRDDEVSKIVEMLTTPTEEAVSILPIVGMGGLGKTTLARNIFNHQKTKTHFGQRIWIHVSQSFDAVTLLKKILMNLKIKFFGYESKQVLLEGLQEALGSATSLLVLDDVWNEDRRKWEEFSKSWSGITCTKGNGIIVTTRSTKVSSLVRTLDTHFLTGLSKEQCWSIIKGRAFAGGDILPEVEAIGRSIAGRCKGLPLAANVFGGMVCDKSQDEWRSIEKKWLSSVGGDENHILEILKLSFHHLPSPSLKKCFAYCSIFPKGSRIDSKQLIELWMAEGFLQTSDMENVGDQFLKVLLHNSLLQVVDKDEYGNVKHCSMHDLVHDVAVLVSGFPRVNGNVPFDIHSNRYICWTHEPRCIPKEQAKWLRTLFYEGKISDIIFSHFESLHALTLKVDHAKNVSVSIKKLIHLRYFHISGADIECLPHSIGELYHLQTLRAETKKLPSTLTCLVNLRHLHVPFHTELPPHLGRLTCLQTLPYFHVRDEDGHRIVELGSLKYLKGELMIDNLEKVKGEEESKKAYLSQKSGIVRLALSWSVKGERREGDDKNVLDGLQPHTSLMILEIAGFNGASFPLWTSKMAVFLEGQWVGLNSLMEIKLSDCLECEDIPSMGHLPRLKSLYLYSLKNIKSIGSSFYCKETISVFPALERLELWDLENLREWEEVGFPGDAPVKAFPRLEYLKIRECKQLTSAPSQFTCLKILIIDEMKSGSPLANICSNKLKTLTELKIGNVDGLTCLPDWLFHNNQRLSVLEIIDCSNLIELPDGMHSLNSLNELNLRRCDSLKSIPYSSSGGLTFLRRLSIWECPKLMNFPVGMVESCAPLLEKLSIDVGDSDSWRRVSFKKSIDGVLRLGSQSLRRLELRGEDWESLPNQLQRLTSLSELWLSGFGIEVLPEWLGDFSSLSKLKVSYCKKLKHLPSAEAMRRLTNLSCLIIYRCPLLEERCIEQQSSDDVDSQWPKICHLLNIRIGGRPIRSGGWQPSMECSNSSILGRLTSHLKNSFAVKDLGQLTYFLGVEMVRCREGLLLSQQKYMVDLLHRFDMGDSKPVSTPMAPSSSLMVSGSVDPSQYRSAIGGLQYLTITRPDIAFAVNRLAQSMAAPSHSDWLAVKRLLRYLKGSIHHGLLLRPPSSLSLTAYSDSDFGGNMSDGKSTSAYVIFLGPNPISWRSRRQRGVARSSTEAEYRALATTAAEVCWITHLFRELGVTLSSPPRLLCDNLGATRLALHPIMHSRMKHIALDLHFVRDLSAKGIFTVAYVNTLDQLADVLTKPLFRSRFLLLRSKISVADGTSILRGHIKDTHLLESS